MEFTKRCFGVCDDVKGEIACLDGGRVLAVALHRLQQCAVQLITVKVRASALSELVCLGLKQLFRTLSIVNIVIISDRDSKLFSHHLIQALNDSDADQF